MVNRRNRTDALLSRAMNSTGNGQHLPDYEFVIVGGGAIGGIMAAGMAAGGHGVLIVDRNRAHVDAIRREGLVLLERGVRRVAAVNACPPAETPDRLRRVLLAVRCVDTAETLQLIKPRLAEDGYVISLQNGLNPLILQSSIGPQRTLGAFVNFQAACTQPGVIQVGRTGSLHIGELDGRIVGRISDLREVFDRIRPTTVSPNIMGLLWSKLAYSSILTATALVDADVREILPAYRGPFLRLIAEPLHLAQLEGATPEPFDVWQPRALVDPDKEIRQDAYQRIVDSWQDRELQRTGTWRDIAVHHRMPDVEDKIGLMLRIAADRLAMPLHATLLQLIKDVAAGTRPMGWDNLKELTRACAPAEQHVE